MISFKHNLKVNNSYESEPSSGSASSLSEHNDCPTYDEENMNLPYLLRPPSYSNEVVVTTSTTPDSRCSHKSFNSGQKTQELVYGKTFNSSQESPFEGFNYSPFRKSESHSYAALSGEMCPVEEVTVIELNSISDQENRQMRYNVPVRSSQESSFEGFNDSPFGKIKRQIFSVPGDHVYPLEAPYAELILSPVKNVIPKFFDTIGENSCNAVDIQLSNDAIQQNSENKEDSPTLYDANPSLELSFNGKFQSQTAISEVSVPAELPILSSGVISRQTSLLNSIQFSESFILKKYSNEQSPDLFGDDDDDADETEKELFKVEPVATQAATSISGDGQYKNQLSSSLNKSFNCPTECSFTDDQMFDYSTQNSDNSQSQHRNNCKREKVLLHRIRKSLAGVPPPPSLTIPQIDMFNAVLSRKDDVLNFLTIPRKTEKTNSNSNTKFNLFKPTHSLEEAKAKTWKDVLGVRQHGLCFNLNKASESNEYLSLAVIDRFVGAETASSYKHSPSSAKKRNTRLKLLTQSPGNRLSHLAKRRAIFSSANLATTSQKSSSLLGHQILIDKKKSKHRRKSTPKRLTPASRKKNRKTPSSSARKRIVRCDHKKPGPSRETSKRALFQSPAKQLQRIIAPPKPTIKPEIANRVEKSKRALFSPDKLSQDSLTSESQQSLSQQSSRNSFTSNLTRSFPLESLLKRKRNPADDLDTDDVELAAQSSKLFRTSAENLTPRALKIKSQSFCIGAGSPSSGVTSAAASMNRYLGLSSSQFAPSTSSTSLLEGKHLQRAHSDMNAQSTSLTENQRKKLLWAVSQALQEKKITSKHESFKQYASVLARIVRRIFQEYYQRGSTSNSETMLRLAKKYAYSVICGKQADDIYLHAKAQIDENKRLSSNRLTGYIGPEEYARRKNSQQLSQSLLQSRTDSIQNIFNIENSIDSFNLSISQTSSVYCTSSQTSLLGCLSQAQEVAVKHNFDSNSMSLIKPQQIQHLPIQPNTALQNSSSKNNLSGLALRENVDCEQRRSAQKNFTGKNQRNVSPYTTLASSSSSLSSGLKTYSNTKLLTEMNAHASGAKVKRKIQFDF